VPTPKRSTTITGSTCAGIGVPLSSAKYATSRSVKKVARLMLANGTSGATGERYVKARMVKITSAVAAVTFPRLSFTAPMVSSPTGRMPVTSARRVPGRSSKTVRISSTSTRMPVPLVPASKKSSTGRTVRSFDGAAVVGSKTASGTANSSRRGPKGPFRYARSASIRSVPALPMPPGSE
jgi:hypothetical protein